MITKALSEHPIKPMLRTCPMRVMPISA
jgi:hypothetical protein